jgi:MEDS: MEthanogen/methylotroph, DcmR Sensory domain
MAHSGSPIVHSVHFYDADEALIQRLQNVITSGLESGNAVLIVATDAHRTQLISALKKRLVQISQFEREGSLCFLNAHETLAQFMVNGLPDRQRFLDSVGAVIQAAKQAARSTGNGLTVFGEMVAVLWEQGNKAGALQLEALWNDLLNDRSFHLHCAYPRSLFADGIDMAGMQSICDGHSHVIGFFN